MTYNILDVRVYELREKERQRERERERQRERERERERERQRERERVRDWVVARQPICDIIRVKTLKPLDLRYLTQKSEPTAPVLRLKQGSPTIRSELI